MTTPLIDWHRLVLGAAPAELAEPSTGNPTIVAVSASTPTRDVKDLNMCVPSQADPAGSDVRTLSLAPFTTTSRRLRYDFATTLRRTHDVLEARRCSACGGRAMTRSDIRRVNVLIAILRCD